MSIFKKLFDWWALTCKISIAVEEKEPLVGVGKIAK